MAFGAENVQPARAQDLLAFSIALGLEFGEGDRELLGIDLGPGLPRGFGVDLGAGHEFRVAAEDDVGPSACHVGRDGDRALAARLRDHVGLAFVLLRIEHAVGDALLAQQRRHDLGLLDADRADEHGLSAFVALLDLGQHGAELAAFVLVHEVVVILAQEGLVGGNHRHVELVDLLELFRFGVGGSGHAGELLVEAEVVLVADGGQGLVLFLDLDAFLGLDGLVEAVRPAPARHLAAGELVDDDDLALFDEVVDVALVQGVGAQGLGHVVQPRDVLGIVEVAHVQPALDPVHARVGQHGRVGLLVDVVVDVLAQGGDDTVDLAVQIRRGLARARNDERRTRLVDEDGVHFVDDGEVEVALHVALDGLLHVVAQVVEPELRVGAVADVAAVVVLALGIGETMDDHADGQPEELVDASHPLGIAAGQVVVHGDQVDTLAGESVQVDGQGGDQGLAFAGLHFRNAAAVQDHAADELHIEVAHVHHAPAGLATHGEGLGQDAVQAFAVGHALLESDGLGAQVVVALALELGFELSDASHDGAHALEDTRVLGAEDFLGDSADQGILPPRAKRGKR